MNTTLKTALIVVGVLALGAGVFLVGTMYGRANGFWPGMMFGTASNNGTSYGPGMMWGRGTYGPDRSLGNRGGYGPGGMMGGRGAYGPGGMMGSRGGYNNANLAPLSVDQAKAAAEKYLANLNDADLKIAEIMVFDNNAYVVVKETSTGKGAFELLVDPATQVAYPEYGPNMMWNLKYGALNHQYMMGGNFGWMMGRAGSMMGGYGSTSTTPANVTADMTVTPAQATETAQKYLDANIAGATAAADPIQFYGYYTLDYTKDGKVAGMLSVNGYSGQVFLHTWHGSFIQESAVQ